MRYAVISDIHANETALRAVVADAADLSADKIVCLGDVLGYGPDPVAALELVYRKVHVCLAGNHDDAVANRCSTDTFTEFAAAAAKRHRELLAHDALDWLRHLPYTCEFDGFACVHGDFSDPKNFNYVAVPEDAIPSWNARGEQLLFAGHTHEPAVFAWDGAGAPRASEPADFTLKPGVRYFVNPGSVGYPRNGEFRTTYCIYDDVRRSVTFRSLPFDFDGYGARMRKLGLEEAPWMRVREEMRRKPEVRGGASFAKPQARRARLHEHAACSGEHRIPGVAIVFATMLLAAAGIFCTVKLTRSMPDPAEFKRLDAVTVAAPQESPAPSANPDVIRSQTIVLGENAERIHFNVRLASGSKPVKLHLTFRDPKNIPMEGTDEWFTIRRSKKHTIPFPPNALYAVMEVLRIRPEDECRISKFYLSTRKEEN